MHTYETIYGNIYVHNFVDWLSLEIEATAAQTTLWSERTAFLSHDLAGHDLLVTFTSEGDIWRVETLVTMLAAELQAWINDVMEIGQMVASNPRIARAMNNCIR